MKTFNYKNQTYTCEVVHKNTNESAKSKCIRIITEGGIRNIYTIANGYSKPVAYCKNSTVLSDIVIGKALCVLGLMGNDGKFVFSKDSNVVDSPCVSKAKVSYTNTVTNTNSMYRVIDINTGSIAMFTSEIDVVSYCIGRTVKVDKIELSMYLTDTSVVVKNDNDDSIEEPTTCEKPNIPDAIKDVAPRRKNKSNYTVSNNNQVSYTSSSDVVSSESADSIPDLTVANIPIEDDAKPSRRRKV